MRLRTLGKVALEHAEFTRPKPLLLLAYLALEGRQERRHVAEFFWPGAADRMKSLTVALTRLRHGAPGSIDADDDHVWATVESDAQQLSWPSWTEASRARRSSCTRGRSSPGST